MEYVNKNEMERLHKGHFFSRSSMKFFNSRISEFGYKNVSTEIIYFVSSEKFENNPRLYTVRSLDKNGVIHSVFEFQSYKSSQGAHKAALRLANKVKESVK